MDSIKFTPRADDVFVATYAKSGTTWLQQIVQQLRSPGSSDYEEICTAVPWFESAYDMGVDIHADQPPPFRAYKSHLPLSELPQASRFVIVVRDPEDVLLSYYRFFEGWWFEKGSISLNQFAEHLYTSNLIAGDHWSHLVEAYRAIDSDRTLVLNYEDMLLNPTAVPAVVAEFLALSLSDESMQKVIEYSSRKYMLANATLFDDHILRDKRDSHWGLPSGGHSAKVTDNSSSNGEALDSHISAALQGRWMQAIAPVLGFANYSEYRAAMPNPLNVNR